MHPSAAYLTVGYEAFLTRARVRSPLGGGAVVHRAWVVHRAVHRAMAGRGLAWVQLTWLEHQLSKVHAAFRKCTLTNLTEAATVRAVDDFNVKLGYTTRLLNVLFVVNA